MGSRSRSPVEAPACVSAKVLTGIDKSVSVMQVKVET